MDHKGEIRHDNISQVFDRATDSGTSFSRQQGTHLAEGGRSADLPPSGQGALLHFYDMWEQDLGWLDRPKAQKVGRLTYVQGPFLSTDLP